MQKIIYIYQSHYASPLVYLIISVPFLEYLAFSLIWDTNTTLYKQLWYRTCTHALSVQTTNMAS